MAAYQTLAIRFQSSRTAPATQLTPSHANGRSANVISILRLMPTLSKVEDTTSPVQQLSFELVILFLLLRIKSPTKGVGAFLHLEVNSDFILLCHLYSDFIISDNELTPYYTL